MSKQVKVMYVGDPHLDFTTPMSRLDDYATTTISKLRSIISQAAQNECSAIILLGDVFHKRQQPIGYLNRVIDVLKTSQVPIYSIVGNHDLANERLDSLETSPLGTLFKSGAVKHLKAINIGGHVIVGRDYTEQVIDQPANATTTTCVAHMFYENSFGTTLDCLQGNSLKPYNYYVLGHDHMPYDHIEHFSGAIILRPGSMTRIAAHKYNLTRQPSAYILNYSLNEVEEVVIEHKSAEEVFSTLVEAREGNKSLANDLEAIRATVERLLQGATNVKDVFDVLEQVNPTPEVRAEIVKYLNSNGIFSKEDLDK